MQNNTDNTVDSVIDSTAAKKAREIKEARAAREKRFMDAVALKEPDRVAIIEPGTNAYPYSDAGYSMAEIMYDLNKTKDAIRKYHLHYDIDCGHSFGACMEGMGPILEKSQNRVRNWAGMPGDLIPEDSIHQFIEFPTMLESEYHDLTKDRSGVALQHILPRTFGLLEPLQHLNLNSIFHSTPSFRSLAAAFARPDFKAMAQELAELDAMYRDWEQQNRAFAVEIEELGYPVMMASPGMITTFDYLSDFLRGTIGASMDLYDSPDEVEDFLDEQVQISLNVLRKFPYPPNRLQFMPLHKGMDGFLSDEHYKRFYWKYLIMWVDTLIELGVTPILYSEGHYSTRLEYLKQLPPAKCIVHFENMDMAVAKKELGDIACISGNFPVHLLTHASVEKVVEEAKRLLDICAPGGGYIFDFDGGLYASKRENVEALFETVKEYGKY